MTELLEKAFNEASKLSPDEQDELASLLLAELESKRRWTASFEKSQDASARQGREALEEDERGETDDVDPADLRPLAPPPPSAKPSIPSPTTFRIVPAEGRPQSLCSGMVIVPS